MESTIKSPVMLYTEQTPNPESLKFVTNRMLYPNDTADFRDRESAAEWSELASHLFSMPYVKGVYLCNNYVTVTKEFNYEWSEIMLAIKNEIKNFIEAGGVVIKEGYAAAQVAASAANEEQYSGDEAETVQKIKNLIDTYVRPAVESDGGNITFKSYAQGKVVVTMQGSCSGCPSSTVTLKAGIEGMMKRMIPEVTEVVAEAG